MQPQKNTTVKFKDTLDSQQFKKFAAFLAWLKKNKQQKIGGKNTARHTWKKDDCIKCGISRQWDTHVVRRAIYRGKDVNTYQSRYKYFVNGVETWDRPLCVPAAPKREPALVVNQGFKGIGK